MDKIIKLWSGAILINRFPPKESKPGEVVLEVEGLVIKVFKRDRCFV